ncbi:MAG TPA: hypothetical protein ENG66_04595 [Thermococcus sp.]|nr:hypothetical protein [Thermococcus sp.]
MLLVNHTIGPTPTEEDSVAVRSLYEAIKLKENVEVIDTHGLTPYDLISLYASARLLIGTRFHSVIFALLSGTPVVAISYFGPKTFGIMKSLGLEQFVLDIGKANAEELKSIIQYVLEHEDQIRKKISVRVERLRKEAIRAGTAFLNLLLKEK